nr:discoidin domain-containing protein [Bacteroidales bacterium]
KLTSDMVEVSANQSGDGDGAPALVDGKEATYWHSPWSSYLQSPDPTYGVYVDITLSSPLNAIVFEYYTRADNGNGVPVHVVVGASNDKSTWTVIGDAATEEMAGAKAGQWVTLPVMKHTSSFKYIRFGIAESVAGDLRKKYSEGSQPFTALGELVLYGTSE